jgi:putative methylase
MMPKNKLSILLSKLADFESPSAKLEQYSTPSDIAADVLWNAYMNGDIENKTIIDAACGPGFLGIGALLLGAKKVYFVDKDIKALNIAARNVKSVEKEKAFSREFVLRDISETKIRADVVIQNPPFGTKKEHADRLFLIKAFESAQVIYSFHKLSTEKFVQSIAADNGFMITHLYKYDFPLKATQSFHEKPVRNIEVGCWRLAKF